MELFKNLKINKNKLLIIGILIYIIFFFIFYPKFITISDEHGYLRQTYLLSKGRITVDDVFYSYKYFYRNGKFVPSYPIGASILALPFALISWKLVFLSGFALHLFNMYILIKIFKRYNINKLYSLLYLLYPGFVFYSRTIMSEIPSITFILLGFYFFIKENKRDYFLSGFMLGISCLMRPTNAVVIIGITLPTIYKTLKNIIINKKIINNETKKLIYFGFGILPSFLMIITFNYIIYGGFFNTSFSAGSLEAYKKTFTFTYSRLLLYWKPIVIMLLVYPLMLVSPLFVKLKKKKEILLTLLLFLIIFGKADVIRYGWLTNLVVGQRYFFPIIPLLLIPYSIFLRKYFKYLVTLGAIALIIVCPVIMYRQSLYTNKNYEVTQQIYNNIPEGSIIVGYIYADMTYLNNYFGENYKVMYMKNLNRSKHSGEYYLVHYDNAALLNNIKKKTDLESVKFSNILFNKMVSSDNFIKIYKNNNLMIYFVTYQTK